MRGAAALALWADAVITTASGFLFEGYEFTHHTGSHSHTAWKPGG